jgi:eukaryotic-like serine/threonine-protein kinase
MDATGSPKKLAGRYEVRQILGQGGMGLVYRAYDTVVRREVAVKTILDIPDPASLQLFYKECDVLASMSHPNIVEIFDIGEFEEDGKKKPYFVMPLLPGKTLDHFVRESSHRLTVERTVEIISQTCRGLQAAHERGLVHRDLKPSNIFVMEDDSVKIIDFGVAHMADANTTRAQKGTLLYMSPEQIQLKPLTAASDIFSLSVVCYEALTGRHPFQRARADEVVEAILNQKPASGLRSKLRHFPAHQPRRPQRDGEAGLAPLQHCARTRRHTFKGFAQRADRVLRSGAHAATLAARYKSAR